jgi:hypothetical protein
LLTACGYTELHFLSNNDLEEGNPKGSSYIARSHIVSEAFESYLPENLFAAFDLRTPSDSSRWGLAPSGGAIVISIPLETNRPSSSRA